jgi:hypothetical protein
VLLRLPGSPMPLLELVPNPLLLGEPFGFGLSLLRVPIPGFAVLPGEFSAAWACTRRAAPGGARTTSTCATTRSRATTRSSASTTRLGECGGGHCEREYSHQYDFLHGFFLLIVGFRRQCG